jgi:hypothetical protein
LRKCLVAPVQQRRLGHLDVWDGSGGNEPDRDGEKGVTVAVTPEFEAAGWGVGIDCVDGPDEGAVLGTPVGFASDGG